VLPSDPTSNGIRGALCRIKDVAYLPCICCKVKARFQGEKCHTLRSRCACVWNMVYENTPSFDMFSLSNLLFLRHGYHFFLFMSIHVLTLFFIVNNS